MVGETQLTLEGSTIATGVAQPYTGRLIGLDDTSTWVGLADRELEFQWNDVRIATAVTDADGYFSIDLIISTTGILKVRYNAYGLAGAMPLTSIAKEGDWVFKACADRTGEGDKHYWDFIGAESYDETVDRAFMTSFLVTYGYATLEIHPLEEETFLVPYEKPVVRSAKTQLVSIPISVSFNEWQKWKRGELK